MAQEWKACNVQIYLKKLQKIMLGEGNSSAEKQLIDDWYIFIRISRAT